MVQPQQIPAVGAAPGADLQGKPCAVFARGDGLRQQIQPLIFAVHNDLAVPHIGGIVHQFARKVVKQIVAHSGLVQPGAVQHPLVMGVHAHQRLGRVAALRIDQPNGIAGLVKAAGGVAPDADTDTALHVWRSVGVMVFAGVRTDDLHLRGDGGLTVLRQNIGGRSLLTVDWAAGNGHAACVDFHDGQIGTQPAVLRVGAGSLRQSAAVLMHSRLCAMLREGQRRGHRQHQCQQTGRKAKQFVFHKQKLSCKSRHSGPRCSRTPPRPACRSPRSGQGAASGRAPASCGTSHR